MQQYRKKPVVIEAEQYSRQQHVDTGYVPEGVTKQRSADDDGAMIERMPVITTLEGTLKVSDGDWIIKGIHGEFYPCKDSIFRQTYESVGSFGEKI